MDKSERDWSFCAGINNEMDNNNFNYIDCRGDFYNG